MRELKVLQTNYNIKKMIIHVNANHITSDTMDQILQQLKNMYDEVKSLFPTTSIYHSEMLPRLNNSILSGINFINTEIAWHCKQLNIKTIEHPQFGYNEINMKMITQRDLVHPTFAGTIALARNMIAVYRNYHRQ